MIDGSAELARRVAELDAGSNIPYHADRLHADLIHFMMVMAVGSDNILRCVSPLDADAFVEHSRLLARLMHAVPEIVAGPFRLNSQYWISTGKPPSVTLSESHFVGASDAAVIELSAKPFGLGLFTSTGVLGTYGMWRMYLDLTRSTLHPLPWYTWTVEPHPNTVVHEIASASQWVELVLSNPRQVRDLLFPDWRSVAHHCDAIHMTLRAIAAIQGLYFPTKQGLVAASYWDIESTFWLRWRFNSVRLVDTVT